MKLFENIFQDKKLLRSLLKQIDVLNTFNGGSVMASVDVIGENESIIIKVSAPSVPVEAFNILLSYTKLTISIFTTEADQEFSEGAFAVPMFLRSFDLPAFVDLDRIEAYHEEGALNVILPYKSTAESLHRNIDIREL